MNTKVNLLEKAKECFLKNDIGMEKAMINRARSEGCPECLLRIREQTFHHMLFPFENYDYSISDYFNDLNNISQVMDKNTDFREEIKNALNTLVNIKLLFIRYIGLHYYSDIARISGGSSLIGYIDNLQEYLKKNYDDIIIKDKYNIKTYLPEVDFNKFTIDVLKVRAYCLNLLLSYTGVQNIAKIGEKYNLEFTSYDTANIRKENEYAEWSIVEPRLYYLNKEAYFDVYLQEYNSVVNQISKYGVFDSPQELRKEIRNITKHKRIHKSDKEFFKYARRFEKDDYSRDSILTMSAFMMPWMGKMGGYVGTFKLNTPFARKILFGVCDMISIWRSWNLETVRLIMFMLCCTPVGIGIYLLLSLSILFKLYLPGLTVRK